MNLFMNLHTLGWRLNHLDPWRAVPSALLAAKIHVTLNAILEMIIIIILNYTVSFIVCFIYLHRNR